MQFFLDTANLREIETGLGWGMVDGVTTNPTLIAREGKPYLPTVAEIARLVPGPVSGEVLATDLPGMLDEGRRLAGLAPNVVVKVPLTPTGLAAVRAFAAEQIRCNVTLCFSAAQALLAAKAGAEPEIVPHHPQPGRSSAARPWGEIVARTFKLKG